MTTARYTININGTHIDTQLPTDEKITYLIPQIITFATQELNKQHHDTTQLKNKQTPWTLTTNLNEPLNPTKTLNQQNIPQGTIITLTPSTQKETYTPLIDDQSEAIAQVQKTNFPHFNTQDAHTYTIYTIPLIAAAIALALITKIPHETTTIIPKLITAIVTLILAVATTIITKNTTNQKLATATTITTYLLAAISPTALIPTNFSWQHILASCATILTFAALNHYTNPNQKHIHLAATTTATLIALATTVTTILKINPTHTAPLLITLTITFITLAPTLAMKAGKIPKPYLPATGETYADETNTDITNLPNPASTQAIQALVNRETQIITARNINLGLMAGAGVTLTIAAGILGHTIDTYNPIFTIPFITATILAIIFRAVSFEDAHLQHTLLVSATLTTITFIETTATSNINPTHLLIYIAALAVASLFSTWVVATAQNYQAVDTRWSIEIVEFVCFFLSILLLAGVIDVYGIIRGTAG